MIELPTPAILRRRCQGLGRLDRALAPDEDVPTHDFARDVFWLREAEGNHVQISFTKKGVLILGFHHESPMSPVHNHEQTWPGVVDELPSALRPVLARYPYRVDVTFCVWRLAGQRLWRSGTIKRPRARDADGSTRLLQILDGNPRRYRSFARSVHELDVPIAVIESAYQGGPIDRSRFSKPAPKKLAAPPKKARFRVGDRVIDEWDTRGKITAVWSNLDDAAAHGEIDDVADWLRGLSIKPKTPRRGVWYTVRPNTGGSMLAGELNLRRA